LPLPRLVFAAGFFYVFLGVGAYIYLDAWTVFGL
jgi:membrane-bound metal-dependent hydrolase YbcI (DUF457 family)